MRRSLLVQTLLDMATGSGGAKLEALVVDAAGTFDAGSGKGYNPVTVPSGTINVLGEKGVVSNNSVVVTPKAQVAGGWLNSGETSGSGVGVTASELVSGTLNVSSDGVQDVTNYQNISVPSGGHSASAHKSVATDHVITVTPRSTATQGFVQAGTVDGVGVEVSAGELVSGELAITENGTHDVTNYKDVNINIPQGATIYSGTVTGSGYSLTLPVPGIKANTPVGVLVVSSSFGTVVGIQSAANINGLKCATWLTNGGGINSNHTTPNVSVGTDTVFVNVSPQIFGQQTYSYVVIY